MEFLLQSLPVIPFDLARMFWGDAPAVFYLEIGVRTLIIYVYALLLVRWVGSRSLAQLSIVEFLLVVALGSAVGDPLFYPDVPLFHAMAAITAVILLNKMIEWILSRCSRAQRLLDGAPVMVIDDSRICLEGARQRKMSRSEIFEQLRLAGIRNLGEIDCAFIESNGQISHFRRELPRRGLPIVPPPEIANPAITEEGGPGYCCRNCGYIAEHVVSTCQHCGSEEWIAAPSPPQLNSG